MLSRTKLAVRVPRALPLRARAPFPVVTARTVTTNAASSSLNHSVPQSDDEPFQVTLSDESFETYELDPPPYTIEVTKKELKQMYYDMVCIRYASYGLPQKVHCPQPNYVAAIDDILIQIATAEAVEASAREPLKPPRFSSNGNGNVDSFDSSMLDLYRKC